MCRVYFETNSIRRIAIESELQISYISILHPDQLLRTSGSYIHTPDAKGTKQPATTPLQQLPENMEGDEATHGTEPHRQTPNLAAEAVEGAALALERVDDVHGCDGLAAGVLRVGDGVADDVLEEDLEHAAGLLIDQPGDALHAAPPRQPPDRRLRDALDVVAEHLPVTLRAALPEPLAALAPARHRRRRRSLPLVVVGGALV